MKNTKTVIIVIAVLFAILAACIAMYDRITNPEKYLFLKAYKDLDKITQELLNDKTLYPDKAGLANTDKVEYKGVVYEGDAKFCGLFAEKLGTKCPFGNALIDKKDRFWVITTLPSDKNNTKDDRIYITVDVNNASGANCIDGMKNCVSPDRFDMVLESDGKITVRGIYGPKYLYGDKKSNNKETKKQ